MKLRFPELGERHAGTAVAAVAMLLAARLPLTSSGLGSATPAVDALSLGSSMDSDVLRWSAWALLAVLSSGFVLGVSLLVPGRVAVAVWWIASIAVLVVGTGALLLGRGDAGGSIVAITVAGVALCVSGCLERRRLAGGPATPT